MSAYAPPAPPVTQGTDPTAVMGRRSLAWVLDLVLFVAVVGSMFAGLADYVEIPAGFPFDACDELQARYGDEASGCVEVGGRAYITSAADSGIQTLVALAYFIFFVVLQGITGASPGKLLTGLRVVDEEGRSAGVGKSLVRSLLWVVDGAPWVVPVVGFVTGLTSTGHRRVGDLAAKTYVVGRRDVGTPPFTLPDTWAPPPSTSPWGDAPPAAPDHDPTAPDPGRVDELVPDISTAPEQPATETPEQPATEWAPPETPGEEFELAGQDPSPTAGPTPFVAPGSQPPTSEELAPMPPPQWDTARNTYIQWHPGEQRWLQWDAAGARWKPIDT